VCGGLLVERYQFVDLGTGEPPAPLDEIIQPSPFRLMGGGVDSEIHMPRLEEVRCAAGR